VNETDTCREFVVPRLIKAGWDTAPHSIAEQRIFTDGRVYLVRGKPNRGKQKKADYLLRYTREFPIAVVEAKADYKKPDDGLAQAKDYAQTLDLKFAYSTNGTGVIEFDFLTGTETALSQFPSQQELWQRLAQDSNLTDRQQEQLLEGFNLQSGRFPRYYQDVAINRVAEAVIAGKSRILLTMATGVGVPFVRIQDLDPYSPSIRPRKVISPEVESSYSRTRLQGTEALIAVVGATIGKVGSVPREWTGANIARAVCRIVPGPAIRREYLIAVLLSPRCQNYFRDVTRTLAQPTLTVAHLAQTPIPLPPLSEQDGILVRLAAVRHQLHRLQHNRSAATAALSALLPAVLDSAFKGEF